MTPDPNTSAKYRDTNERRIVIQIGGVCTFCQEEGILLQMYRDTDGRCIAILFKSIGVRGRFDSPGFRLFYQSLDMWVLSNVRLLQAYTLGAASRRLELTPLARLILGNGN